MSTAAWPSPLAGGPFNYPTGAVLPYAGVSAPVGWLMCNGQSVSRTTYALLFAVIGTTYGTNDALSFNLPDLRGRVVAGVDTMGGTAANRLTIAKSGINAASLGATGGYDGYTLSAAQCAMPSHSHTATATDSGHTHGQVWNNSSGTCGITCSTPNYGGTSGYTDVGKALITVNVASNAATPTASASVPVCQPTMVMNYMIKF